MSWSATLALLLGGYVFLMAIGLPVAFAFFGINLVGAFLFLGGEIGFHQLARNSMGALTNFILTPIPLFLLMGEILFETGVAVRAIDAIDKLIARVPGRLSIVSIIGGTLFSSLSGSTIANTAVLGSTLLPNMIQRNYHPTFAMGPIMAVGGIAMLIPPSALAVLLGSLAGISIAKLLIAGIVPGILMSVLFLVYVVGRSATNPSLAPAYDVAHLTLWQRWRPFLIYVVPLFSIFVVVVGSIFAGLATPTESSALGCIACLIIAIAYGSLTPRNLMNALQETAKIYAMVLFIIVASLTFSQILALSGATDGLLSLITGADLSKFTVVLGMLLILLFLGAFMDQVSMMLITLPLYMPMAETMGIDVVWLGVLILVSMEVSLLTPPFGILLYTMKGVAPREITLQQIWWAAAPFIGLELLVLALLVAFPVLALWLPSVTIK